MNKNKISFATMKATPILETIDGIEIYDINCKANAEIRVEFFKCLTDTLTSYIKEDEDEIKLESFESVGTKLLLEIFPILTNATFEDMTEDEVNQVMNEPSPTLTKVTKVLTKITNEAFEQIDDLIKLDQMKKSNPSKEDLLKKLKEEEKARKKAKLEAEIAALENEEEIEVLS